MRMLVTGATGFVGSTLIPRLLADSHEIRALARNPSATAPAAGVEVVQGDVLTGAGLAAAVEGVEVAYYLVHSMEGRRAQGRQAIDHRVDHRVEGRKVEDRQIEDRPVEDRPVEDRPVKDRQVEDRQVKDRQVEDRRAAEGDGATALSATSLPQRERIGAIRFAAAARDAGVRRIVYLGGLMPSAGEASRHLESRVEVERILLSAIPDSVALRSSIVIGARSRSFRLLVRLVERIPVLALPAWRSHSTQPIDARDVTEMLAAAAYASDLGGRSLDIGGPEKISYEDLLSRIAELMVLGRPRLRIGVSMTVIAARIAAAIAGEDPELVLPLMEGLHGDLLPEHDASAILGVPLHPLDSAIEHALWEWERDEPLSAR